MGRLTTAKKSGASRLYFCQPCGAKHTPPTGLRCKRQKQSDEGAVENNGAESSTSEPEAGPSKPTREVRKKTTRASTKSPVRAKDAQTTKQKSRKTDKGTPTTESPTVPDTSEMFEMLLGQMRSMTEETKRARDTDRAAFQKAIQDLTNKIEAPILSDEDMTPEPRAEPGNTMFAMPVQKKKAKKSSRVDPIAQLRADTA